MHEILFTLFVISLSLVISRMQGPMENVFGNMLISEVMLARLI